MSDGNKNTNATPKRVLILGGGFGGLYAALEIERTLARDANVQVTLVSSDNFFLFTPLLHEVAASDVDITHIVNPLHKLLRRVNFFCGDVEAIDLPDRRVRVSHGSTPPHSHELEYDHLVLALGAVTNFFGTPGVAERSQGQGALGDAATLRNRLIETLEVADSDCFVQMRQPLLTFVVAGGGFAGVETAGAVSDFLRDAKRHYPNLRSSRSRVVLVHSGPTLLPELDPKLGAYAARKLAEHGVDVRLNTRVSGAADGCVTLSDNTDIPASSLVWTARTCAHPLIDTLPCARERGRVRVAPFLQVPDWPGVWAVGDAAHIPDPNGKPYPPTAQHALREGKIVARNITAAVQNSARREAFAFSTIGQLASIGRRRGVASVLGVHFSGFVAWWLWRTVYLSKLPRFEKKLRVMLDWTLDLFFSKDLVQFTTPPPQRNFRPPLDCEDKQERRRSEPKTPFRDQERNQPNGNHATKPANPRPARHRRRRDSSSGNAVCRAFFRLRCCGGARRRPRSGHGEQHARARTGRWPVAEHRKRRADQTGRAAGQSHPRPILDVWLHQLPAQPARLRSPAPTLRAQRRGPHRRSHAGVRPRARFGQRRSLRQAKQHRLPDSARRQKRKLEALEARVLAHRLRARQAEPHALPLGR
jgi:NADH dehydrogenase